MSWNGPRKKTRQGELKMKRWMVYVTVLGMLTLGVSSLGWAGPLPTAEKSCKYNGKIYKHNASFPAKDKCNTCTCYNGAVGCTEKYCAKCLYGGVSYKHNQSFASQDGCNTCTCKSGTVQCSKRQCPSCIVGKKRYAHNTTFNAQDPCNQCTCYKGRIYCTKNNCKACRYSGRNYTNGATFRAADSCNRCLCRKGQVYCTSRKCIKSCRYFGKRYRHGQVFSVPGKTCRCKQGMVRCTPKLPTIQIPPRLTPVGPNKCANFYYKICKKTKDCKAGYRCTNFSNGCRSSICFCNKKTGKIGGCTMDCLRGYGVCTRAIGP